MLTVSGVSARTFKHDRNEYGGVSVFVNLVFLSYL